MSEEQVRVACPACGKRFRLDPASIAEGAGKRMQTRAKRVTEEMERLGDSTRKLTNIPSETGGGEAALRELLSRPYDLLPTAGKLRLARF